MAKWGSNVQEMIDTIDDFSEALQEGRIMEVFGTGPAAIVSQVSEIHYEGEDYNIPTPSTSSDSLGIRLMEEILAIQYGERGDHPWSIVVG
jgi:branched-chain amino acid aminotransferase